MTLKHRWRHMLCDLLYTSIAIYIVLSAVCYRVVYGIQYKLPNIDVIIQYFHLKYAILMVILMK